MLAQAGATPIALMNASTPPAGLWGSISLEARSFLFRRVSFWTYVDTAAATTWEPYTREHSRGLVTGNPRVDRALLRVEAAKKQGASDIAQKLESAVGESPLIVVGSSWPQDEELLLRCLRHIRTLSGLEKTKILFVPHEPSEESSHALIQKCVSMGFKASVIEPWSADVKNSEVLIANVRGVLVELYGLGKCAYVGGGFGKHVHSVIEPLAHGIPVALGPRHHRAPEVDTLIALGAAYVAQHPIQSADNLAQWLADGLRDGEKTVRAREALDLFVKVHRGSGERIAIFLQEQLGDLPWKK
jgi:3-deoxy-D-manno-octulosonic-acid transferase